MHHAERDKKIAITFRKRVFIYLSIFFERDEESQYSLENTFVNCLFIYFIYHYYLSHYDNDDRVRKTAVSFHYHRNSIRGGRKGGRGGGGRGLAFIMFITIWCFLSLTTEFKSYRDDEGLIMKGSVQRSVV